MWQRRALQAELGQAVAMIQISSGALQRYANSRPAVTFGSVSYVTGTSSDEGSILLPGTEWRVNSTSREIRVTGLSLSGLDRDSAGGARAVWTISFSGTDSSSTAYGKFLYGGIEASSPLGELVQRYEATYGKIGPGLIRVPWGKPVIKWATSSQTNWSATGTLRTPLTTSVNPASGAVTLRAGLTGASFTLPSGGALQTEIADRLAQLLPGGVPALSPDLSLLGALNGNEAAPEVVPVFCQVRTSSTNGALAVYASSQSGAAVPQQPTDLTAGADCAYLTRETVIQKTLAFCMRTGRMPLHLRNVTDTQMTSAGPVTTVTRFDVDAASIALAAFDAQSARQEDHADLRLFTHASLVSVTMPDGSPAPAELRNQITVEANAEWVDRLYFSNVGMAMPNPDPVANAWFQAWRAQVSRRFSVPFVSVAASTLLERSLNGIEKLLLTRQNLVY